MMFIARLLLFSALFVLPISAQTDNSATNEKLEIITREMVTVSKSLKDLTKLFENFAQTFSSNQGLRLSESQQKILFAFELVNRAETRLSTLKLLKIKLVEKDSETRSKITKIDEDMRPENIDRTLGGTFDAEQVRTQRRQTLNREKTELTRLADEIKNSIDETNEEIHQTELFLRNIRQMIFPEIHKELEKNP